MSYKKLIMLVCFLLAGCQAAEINNDRFREPYESNRAQWISASTGSYIFNYHESGFTPIQGTWEIQVNNGDVIVVNYLGSDTPPVNLTLDTAPTIESLYARINSCFDHNDCEIQELEFDSSRNFPTKFYASSGEEGWGFDIAQFVVL